MNYVEIWYFQNDKDASERTQHQNADQFRYNEAS